MLDGADVIGAISTKSQLNNWLRAQRSTGNLQRKGGRLNVVSEVSEEVEG